MEKESSNAVYIAPAVRFTITRVVKYMAVRAVILVVMLAIGIYVAVIVANFGGFIDAMYRANIDEAIQFSVPPPDLKPEEVQAWADQMRASLTEAYGLNQPFLLRCVNWAWKAAIFDWGNTYRFQTLNNTSGSVRVVVAEAFPNSLLLFATANVLLFIASLLVAFVLFRHYGGWFDKLMTNLAVLSAIPNWIFGALLTLLLAVQFPLLPWGGMIDHVPNQSGVEYFWGVVRHMILPVTAIILSLFFQSVATWRALFLLQASEDYVELAKAKGLPTNMIDQRYLVRPTLPYIVTSFAMLMVGMWQNIMALELWFSWPGIGRLLYLAIGAGNIDRPVILAIIVTFAYILAGTVFILDLLYTILDPRVRLDSGGQTYQVAGRKRWTLNLWAWLKRPRIKFQAEALEARPRPRRTRVSAPPSRMFRNFVEPIFVELERNPSSVIGLTIIVILVVVSLYAVLAVPYGRVARQWRPDLQNWYLNPVLAKPSWYNFLLKDKLPESLYLNSAKPDARISKQVERLSETSDRITLSYKIEHRSRDIPQDIVLYLDAQFLEKRPFVTLTWLTPDGRTINLGNFAIIQQDVFYFSGDTKLRKRFGVKEGDIMRALYLNPAAANGNAVTGTYTLQMQVITFEPGNDVNANLVVYGKVFGLAGTDASRRDLTLGLLWGAPVALTFGLIGAVCTALATMFLAAIGVWFGGWVDNLIQRLTEISMILPMLPIAMTVYFLYAKSVWAILGVIVLLSIFGSSMKNYRAAFMQVKEAPYIEAARVYGASDWRIIWQYLVPRVLPIFIPQLIILVPGFVFLESTLAFLKVSDIYLPTWGKMIYDAIDGNALPGSAYWLVEPLALLLITGLAFALLGMTLDRILNPRLRAR